MRILILSTALASHTIKWVRSLSEKNEVILFSLPSPEVEIFDAFPNLIVKSLNINNEITTTEGCKGKFRYIQAIAIIKKLIKDFKPDILHAHYATSYGLLGSLTGFHPYVLSVWGADVYDFPKKSILHRKLIEYNLKKADIVLSTSHVMAKETHKYTNKEILVTPFGIDTSIFKKKSAKSIFEKDSVVVGTVKTLEEKYGVDYLINAFAIVRNKYPNLKLKLLVVGGGSQEYALKELTKNLRIEIDTVFTGRINFDEIVSFYNMLDIYVAVSVLDSESFGVAVLEASACEKPVIVSDVGGLPEVVEDGVTGIIVPVRNIDATAKAIEQLIHNEGLRRQFGINGRKRVLERYDWDQNMKLMISIYNEILSK